MIIIKRLLNIFLLNLCLFNSSVTFAQTAKNITGKVFRKYVKGEYKFQMINNLQGKDKLYYANMKKELLRVFNLVINSPVVNPPKGFEVHPSITAYEMEGTKVCQGSVSLTCFNYYRDFNNPNKIDLGEESHGGLELYINDISSILPKVAYLRYKTGPGKYIYVLPRIILKNKTEIRLNKNIIIFKKENLPLFIPLTKQEFIKFRIKEIKNDLASAENEIKMKDENMIRGYEDSLFTLSPEKLSLPVYVKQDLSHPEFDIYKLCSPFEPGAKAFYKINLQYYNLTLTKTAVQLMIIKYHASNFCPPFLKQRLKNWFQRLNYNQLSSIITK